MILERHQLLELDSLLNQLLSLKDSDFTKFLNNSDSETLKPFFICLQGFWSTATNISVDDLTLDLHEKFFKFLLRLCPSFNNKLPSGSSSDIPPLRAVICPKRVVNGLFDLDPLGLLCYLFETWNPNHLLDMIRDELVPSNIFKHSSFNPTVISNDQNQKSIGIDFIKWLTKNSFKGSLKNNERYKANLFIFVCFTFIISFH